MRISLNGLNRRTSKVSHFRFVQDIVRVYGPKIVHVCIQGSLEFRVSRKNIGHHHGIPVLVFHQSANSRDDGILKALETDRV